MPAGLFAQTVHQAHDSRRITAPSREPHRLGGVCGQDALRGDVGKLVGPVGQAEEQGRGQRATLSESTQRKLLSSTGRSMGLSVGARRRQRKRAAP